MAIEVRIPTILRTYTGGAKSVEGAGGPSSMLVRRKMFGKYRYEPIERYSALLTKYNEAIDMTHLYVLPEHYASAKAAIERFSA